MQWWFESDIMQWWIESDTMQRWFGSDIIQWWRESDSMHWWIECHSVSIVHGFSSQNSGAPLRQTLHFPDKDSQDDSWKMVFKSLLNKTIWHDFALVPVTCQCRATCARPQIWNWLQGNNHVVFIMLLANTINMNAVRSSLLFTQTKLAMLPWHELTVPEPWSSGASAEGLAPELQGPPSEAWEQTTWAQWMHPRQRCCTSEESSRCCSPGPLQSPCELPRSPQTLCWFAWPSKRGTRTIHQDHHHALEVHSMATSTIRCLGWTPRPQSQDRPSFQFSKCWGPKSACPLHTVWPWRHSCKALSARPGLCTMPHAAFQVQSSCDWPPPWHTWSWWRRLSRVGTDESFPSCTFEYRLFVWWPSTHPWGMIQFWFHSQCKNHLRQRWVAPVSLACSWWWLCSCHESHWLLPGSPSDWPAGMGSSNCLLHRIPTASAVGEKQTWRKKMGRWHESLKIQMQNQKQRDQI